MIQDKSHQLCQGDSGLHAASFCSRFILRAASATVREASGRAPPVALAGAGGGVCGGGCSGDMVGTAEASVPRRRLLLAGGAGGCPGRVGAPGQGGPAAAVAPPLAISPCSLGCMRAPPPPAAPALTGCACICKLGLTRARSAYMALRVLCLYAERLSQRATAKHILWQSTTAYSSGACPKLDF